METMKIDNKQKNAIRIYIMDVLSEYQKVKKGVNSLGYSVSTYSRKHSGALNLLSLMDPDDPDLETYKRELEDYSPNSLTGLDEEEYESINQIEGFIDTYYEKNKHDGRYALGLFRSLIKAGNFPANYLAEFDRRFNT